MKRKTYINQTVRAEGNIIDAEFRHCVLIWPHGNKNVFEGNIIDDCRFVYEDEYGAAHEFQTPIVVSVEGAADLRVSGGEEASENDQPSE